MHAPQMCCAPGGLSGQGQVKEGCTDKHHLMLCLSECINLSLSMVKMHTKGMGILWQLQPTCMAYVLCQLCRLLHAGHAMLLLLWLSYIHNVCFVNGRLLNHTHSSKLPETVDEHFADIPVGLVRHPAACFHVHMVYNTSGLA